MAQLFFYHFATIFGQVSQTGVSDSLLYALFLNLYRRIGYRLRSSENAEKVWAPRTCHSWDNNGYWGGHGWLFGSTKTSCWLLPMKVVQTMLEKNTTNLTLTLTLITKKRIKWWIISGYWWLIAIDVFTTFDRRIFRLETRIRRKRRLHNNPHNLTTENVKI